MAEYRFYSFSDYAFTTNRSQNIINLPIVPFSSKINYVSNNLARTQDAPSDNPTTDLNIPYTVFEILVAIVSIIGNLMVIIVFRRERKLRRRTNYYIISLAMADFLVGSLGVPFALLASIGLPRNLHACLFTVSLLVVLCTISIFCLVAVSVDRYWAILYPLAYSRNVRTRTAIVIISMCWVAGTIVGFLPLFGWHADVEHNQACLFVEVMDYDYLVFLYIATIITPALLMLAFYTHIYRVIIKQVRQIVTMNPASDLSRRSSTAPMQITAPGRGGTMLRVLGAARKRDVKATQNLSIIVLFFMICWIPLYTINCIKAFCPDCYVPPKLTYFCIILSHLNSAVNPVLYAYHLKDFRAALKNLLLKLMGVDIDQQTDAMHRFSLASQHRLQSMDNVRPSQPRLYVDSPIWLRQQQEALKNSQLLPKCGVVSPCFNNINQTVAAVASVTTDIEHDMWNIMEASSGAELGEVNYEFPNAKQDSDRDSSLSASLSDPGQRRTSQQHHQQQQLQQQQQQQQQSMPTRQQHRCDSAYSYDNQNYSSSADDNEFDIADDEVEYEDVFVPQGAVDPVELSRSLASVMREKLRSDDTDYQQHSLNSESDDLEQQLHKARVACSMHSIQPSPSNSKRLRQKLLAGGSNSAHCLPAAAATAAAASAVYVIDSDPTALSQSSPGHKPKYRKGSAANRKSRQLSRPCSCNSDSISPPAVNSSKDHKILNEQQQLALAQPPQHHETFLKSMGNYMLPIGKHSNFFHIFQTTRPVANERPTPAISPMPTPAAGTPAASPPSTSVTSSLPLPTASSIEES